MAAQFRIDQVTPGAGVAGRSRHDLVAGEIISLVATSPAPGVGITFSWELIDKRGNNAAVLSASTGTTVSIGPFGSITAPVAFLIELTVNDNGTITKDRRIASVRTVNKNLRVAVFRETASSSATLALNDPALSTDNALYANRSGLGAGQNPFGWSEWAYEVVMAIEACEAITQLTGDVTAGPGAGSQAALVVALQGVDVSNAAPNNGDVLTYNNGVTQWEPQAPAGGGGSLQTAYDFAAPTIVTDASGPLIIQRATGGGNVGSTTLTVSDTDTSGTVSATLAVARQPTAAGTGDALTVKTGANLTGSGIAVDHGGLGTGLLVNVVVNGQPIADFKDGGTSAMKVQSSAITVAATQILAPTGSAAVPSYSLSGDPDTGIYGSGDKLKFSAGGTETARVTSSGIQGVLAGSAAAPSVGIGPTGHGLYEKSATEIGLGIAGTERLVFGATNTATALPLVITGSTAAAPALQVDGDKAGIYSDAGNTLKISTNNIQRFAIDTASVTSTLPFVGPAGTAANPTYSPLANAGLYSTGADAVGISTASTLRVTVNTATVTSTLPFVGPSGSAANPSFSPLAGAGLYSTGANAVGISTNSVLRLTVDTAALTTTLPLLAPAGAVGAPSLAFSANPTDGFYQPVANNITLSLAGVARYAFTASGIATSGNITIGAATAAAIGMVGGWAGTANGPLYALSSTQYTASTAVEQMALRVYGGVNQTSTASFASIYTNQTLSADGATGAPVFGSGGGFHLDLNVTGVRKAAITSAGEMLVTGTVSLPGYSFVGDTNTGIYSVGADSLGIATGGTLRLTVATAGITAAVTMSMSSTKITSLADGTVDADAANLGQVRQPSTRSVSGSTDTIVVGDVGNLILMTRAGGCTFDLPTLASGLISGRMQQITIQATDAAGVITVDPNTSVTIDGSGSNYVAATGKARVVLFSIDGLAWFSGTP